MEKKRCDLENKISKNLYIAMLKRLESRKAEALTMIQLYMEKSVGITDHSDILNEIEKWLSILSDSEGKIECLEKNFNSYSE